MHIGLPTQPAVKLPAFAHPVTAVAFSPSACTSRSAAEGSGRDILAVGLESGALQLWGLHKNVTASGSAHTGSPITVHCSKLASRHVNMQARLCRRPKTMPVCCRMQGCFIDAGAELLWAAPNRMAHCAAIRRLCWTCYESEGPSKDTEGARKHHLASCGEDHLVRVYIVHLHLIASHSNKLA